jgi:hypothetical protein
VTRSLRICVWTLALALCVCLTPVPALADPGVAVLTPESGQAFARSHISVTASAELGVTLRLLVDGVSFGEAKTVPPQALDLVADLPYDGAWTFVNVALPMGPSALTVQVVDGTAAGQTETRSVHVVGPPASVEVTPREERVLADSVGAGEMVVTVRDAWGVASPDGTIVTLEVEGANFVAEDLDPSRPGTQLHLSDGQLAVELTPRAEPGDVEVTALADNVSGSGRVYYAQKLTPLMLVGVAGARAGHIGQSGPLDLGAADPDRYGAGLYTDGRLGMYLKGGVFERYLVTGSYDSDRYYEDRLFRELRPDRLYPIYGDSSSIFFDAQSSAKGYLKVERDESYVLFGDFDSDLSQNELAAYDRSFTGARIAARGENHEATAIVTRTDRRVARDEIPGRGVSGYYFLSDSPVIEGSEKVRIEVRDELHSERVIRSDVRHRYIDYDIDYEQGSLFFKQPVRTRDRDFNPVWIVVVYEAVTDAEKDVVVAAHAQVGQRDTVYLGGTVIDEQMAEDRYRLVGANFGARAPGGVNVTGEYARSESESVEDDAWKIDVNATPTSWSQVSGNYQDIGDAFVNASSHSREIGSRKYGASASVATGQFGEASVRHYKTQQRSISYGFDPEAPSAVDLDVQSTSAGYDATGRYLGGGARIEDLLLTDAIRARETKSTVASVYAETEALKRARLSVRRDQRVRGDEQSYRPDATTLGAEFPLTDNVSLAAMHKFVDGAPLSFDATTVGINSNAVGGWAANTEYRVGGAIGGQSSLASVGLRNRWQVTPELRANVSLQRVRLVDDIQGPGDNDSLSTALEYIPSSPFRITTKFERSDLFGASRTTVEGNAAARVADGFALIGKHRHTLDERSLGETVSVATIRSTVGVAYRPRSHNVLNGLARAEYRRDENEFVEPFLRAEEGIGSIEGVLHPTRRLQIQGKYAVRLAREGIPGGKASEAWTDLVQGRVTVDVTRRVDVAVEARALHQYQVDDRRVGYAVEAGVWPVRNVRVALGYNLNGAVEQGFDAEDSWAYGPYMRFQVKFNRVGLSLPHEAAEVLPQEGTDGSAAHNARWVGR